SPSYCSNCRRTNRARLPPARALALGFSQSLRRVLITAVSILRTDPFTWNHAAEKVFGWSAGEILGKHMSVIVPPELLRAGQLERISEEVHRHGSYHFETRRLAKDGRQVPVEATVSVLLDPQGSPIGRSAIL